MEELTGHSRESSKSHRNKAFCSSHKKRNLDKQGRARNISSRQTATEGEEVTDTIRTNPKPGCHAEEGETMLSPQDKRVIKEQHALSPQWSDHHGDVLAVLQESGIIYCARR